jgi:archaellum biogenesis ATPase FlaH
MNRIGEYYTRDENVQAVDHHVLLEQIAATIRNEKHVARFTELVAESLATETSDANVRAIVLLAKQQEVGDALAQALAMDSTQAKVDDLIAELTRLRSLTNLDELAGEGLEVFKNIDLADLIAREFNPEGLIKLYPSSLNDRLDGGIRGGHDITVFAPVEAGKTAFCVNATGGFARQNIRTNYYINEDRAADIIMRLVSCLSGMNKYEIQANPEKAQRLALDNGFANVTVISCSPGTPDQIEQGIEEHEAQAVVVDQLRNLKVKAESRVNQLEASATAMRNIFKKREVAGLCVTQAADSASGKLILETGDVDFSNVGIPAQADVMVGIGMDAEFEAEGLRMISLPKNKISGKHDHFPVRIIPTLSRIVSV